MDDGFNDGGAMEFAQRGAEEQMREESMRNDPLTQERFFSGERQESMNIYQRMAAVMKDVSYVQKEDKKVNNQYTFVSHDAVTAKIRPALLAHGILPVVSVKDHTQDGNRTEASILVRFVNIDTPSEFIEVESFGYGIDPQDKGPGKAVSYAFKYALLKVFCLETGDDPERDSIDHQPRPFFDANSTFGYIANATNEKALKNLYRQSLEQGATPEQMAKVADACAARKAILQREAQ